MKVEIPDTKDCPVNDFKPCKQASCAFWMELIDPEGKPIGGECAYHSMGHINYSLKALAGIIHAHFHMGGKRVQGRENNRKGKKK